MSETTAQTETEGTGRISSVSGPVVVATGLDARMNDVVYVGEEGLMGEVIEIEGDRTTIQVYEETSGVAPGEPVENTGKPLAVDLGPGMLDTIYDGVQRPLDVLETKMGTAFLDRGVDAPGIDLEKTWDFEPSVEEGERVEPGDVLGTVPETVSIDHKVLVPPDSDGGEVTSIEAGSFTVTEPVAELDSGEEITMRQEWPVREPRPTVEKHSPTIPLISGQRILDGLFPIAKGGTAAIPGPFGSGKCVPPGTPVLLASGETVPIEELFDRYTDDVPADGEVLAEADAEIMTFDEDAETIRAASISAVYRGQTDRLVRIRTASGRTIEVTPAHKLFRFEEGMQISETPAATLAVGDSLVMPRQLEIEGERCDLDPYDLVPDSRAVDPTVRETVGTWITDCELTFADVAEATNVSEGVVNNYANQCTAPPLAFIDALCETLDRDRPEVTRIKAGSNGKSIAIPSTTTPKLAEFLGLLFSDGMVTTKTIRFHNSDDELRARFAELASTLFDLEATETVHNTIETVLLHSRGLSTWLQSLGMPAEQKSRRVDVPDVVKAGDEQVVGAFVRGYYLGDGSMSGGTVEIATSSDAMATDLSYLLTRLGVLFRHRQRDNGGHRLMITSSTELGSFVEAIVSDVDHPKIDAVRNYAEHTVGNTNVDTVPVDPSTMQALADAARSSDFADAGVEITNSTGLGQSPSKSAMETIESTIADGGTDVAERASSVVSMMEDVFFDPIVEIETVEEEQEVYDVTVPDTQNFVGGELPTVLHNTVTQHQLAKWADADIVVYVGCGERGNEMTEVIEDFPELEDPVTGKPLMSRTCLIANTSNMPVAARESCVYTGITIAEYYRDMGYDVALMADSTSRWAEAMREISSRLEEMPGEEGYPAYLAARLSEFYERAGRFTLLNDEEGSVSVIGAVSPPGGDFSEPVTQNTLRIVKAFWALDADLAERRHFPAINWDDSYSLYRNQLDRWFTENVAEDWSEVRQWAIDTLAEESELQEIVQLVGQDALPDDQQLTLEVARYIREGFLQQNAFHDVDAFCSPEKTYAIWQAIQTFDDEAFRALEAGVPVDEITGIDAAPRINRIGTQEDWEEYVDDLEEELATQLRELYEA